MADKLSAIYAIGFFATWIALYLRVGFPPHRGWLEFLLPNLWWFALMVVKIWGWPITLAHWIYAGCPPSRWQAVTSLNGREARSIVRVEPV
ncbi:MAG TPA: hypothetical protein VN238_07690 [Solirubrobacteraceae bacterium]|nr:hypothetical protein [Solirubrobacteraceae bacterium]